MKNLFVTDLDGTYVKNSVFVEKEDLKAYHDAKNYGDFSVATGRSVEEIKYIAEGNDMDVTHMIGFNGAVVTRQDEVLFEKHIPTKDLTGIFKYLKESKLVFDALDGKQRIGNFDHEKKDRLWNMELICVENPFEILKGKTIYKINVRPTKEQLDYHYDIMKEKFPEVEVVAGTATAGIPHAAWVSEVLDLPMIYVRDSAKKHGKTNQIEGRLLEGQRVVIIEDLISTGLSSLKVAKALEEAGAEVLGVVAIFSYELKKAQDAFAADKVEYHTLTNYNFLIEEAVASNYIKQEDVEKLLEWRNNL